MAVRRHLPPIAMGFVMGPMMLWILHDTLMGNKGDATWAAAGFVLAHVLIFGVALFGAMFVSRLSPRLGEFLARQHRPSLGHVAAMLNSAGVSALIVHLLIHGGA